MDNKWNAKLNVFIKHVLEVSLSGNDALFRYIFFNIYPIVHNIRMSWIIRQISSVLCRCPSRDGRFLYWTNFSCNRYNFDIKNGLCWTLNVCFPEWKVAKQKSVCGLHRGLFHLDQISKKKTTINWKSLLCYQSNIIMQCTVYCCNSVMSRQLLVKANIL
jgi:hypothetical protein